MIPNHPTIQGLLGAAAVVAMWTGFILIGRLGVTHNLTAPDVIALRYATAALVLLPLWYRHGCPNLLRRPLILLAGLGGVAYASFTYAGFALAPAAHAGLLLPGLLPLGTTLLAWWLLGQRPSFAQWVANAGILAGLALFLGLARDAFHPSRLGDLLLVAGSLCWSLYGVLMRRWRVTPIETAAAVAVFTAIAYLPVYWFWLPTGIHHASADELILQIIYQGVIASVIQMLIYVRTVQLIGPARLTMAMAFIAPLVALAAVPLLGESVTLGLVAAIGVTAISAWWGGYAARPLPITSSHALR